MALLEYLGKFGLQLDDDLIREGVRAVIQAVIEAEVTQRIGAKPYERTTERVTQRNGYRERPYETRVGEVTLLVPKLREGSYFPSFLEPRRRAEKALLAVVQSAYVEGVSTRKVDTLLQSLGLTGIDKSAVSRVCQALDEPVQAFRERPLEGDYPYVWLDATYLKVRQNHRVVSMAGVALYPTHHRGAGDGGARSAGLCGGGQRRSILLARVPAQPGTPRAAGGAAGHQRRPRGAQGGPGPGAEWRELATLPGALYA